MTWYIEAGPERKTYRGKKLDCDGLVILKHRGFEARVTPEFWDALLKHPLVIAKAKRRKSRR